MFVLNGGTAQSSNMFNNLAVGTYNLVVTDQEGCSSNLSFEIDEILVATFAADIAPIIQTRCAISGCHVTGGAAPFTMNNYAQISANAARIKARTQAGTMPPAGRTGLSQLQVDLIAAWVDAGALDN